MEGTRHSVGMAVLGALAARLGMANRWRGDSHVSGEVILTEVQHTRVVLLRPRLLMNINGVSVAKAAGKYGIKPEDVLLVHDEMDKPLGKIVFFLVVSYPQIPHPPPRPVSPRSRTSCAALPSYTLLLSGPLEAGQVNIRNCNHTKQEKNVKKIWLVKVK
uniref:Peptidyl-tRNA hydrolase 1 homolog n=1 Tax=Cyprinodon variegatus TaxID=28743 RepID=A0A3Q2CCU5_CYPVA